MAKTRFRKIAKIIFIVINSIVVLLFLLACLAPWLNPASYWWVGFAGLLMPYLILVLIFSAIFWLIVKPSLALVPVITLILGWQQLHVIFALHTKATFVKTKNEHTLRIVDWNVQSFNGLSKNKQVKKRVGEELSASVIKLDPDIICFQEFNHASGQGVQADHLSLFAELYPYHYFSNDYQRNKGAYHSGCIIFSKYPVIDSGKIKYKTAESMIYADIVKGTDTFRIYTTHLQSYKFVKEDYDGIERIKQTDEDALIASKNIFYKMKRAFQLRGLQTIIVRTETDKSPYPSVICGDFNDVPNSYTYFHIKGYRQDAFLQKGFGIGRSFISLAPTLRIDYILPDTNFEVEQFDMVDEDLSDHIMLVTDLRLKK